MAAEFAHSGSSEVDRLGKHPEFAPGLALEDLIEQNFSVDRRVIADNFLVFMGAASIASLHDHPAGEEIQLFGTDLSLQKTSAALIRLTAAASAEIVSFGTPIDNPYHMAAEDLRTGPVMYLHPSAFHEYLINAARIKRGIFIAKAIPDMRDLGLVRMLDRDLEYAGRRKLDARPANIVPDLADFFENAKRRIS
jgi:hypothetical protein